MLTPDQSALARILREQLRIGREQMALSDAPPNASQWTRGDELTTRAQVIALEFSERDGFPRAEFLAACGMTQ